MPHKKIQMKSEYGGAFKSWKEEAEKEWRENLKARVARREKEERHEPWAWSLACDEEENEDCSDEEDKNIEFKDVIIKDCQENFEETDSDYDGSGAKEGRNVFCEPGDDLVARLKKRALRKVKEMECKDRETQENQSNDIGRRPHHPLRGAKETFQRSQSLRSKSKQLLEKPRKISPFNNNKPFLSYGWGSTSEENGRKKTFNVNSNSDVYPSATRALNNLTSKKQEKHLQEDDKGRPKTTGDSKRLSNRQKCCRSACSSRNINIDNKGAITWLSEYQQRYPTYTNDVYRRCLANLAPRGHFARLDSPRTCRI